MSLGSFRAISPAAALVLVLFACTTSDPEAVVPEEPVLTGLERVLTLGDIDPDSPARRTKLLQPLAEHLANRLAEQGVGRGRVIIARDIGQMKTFLLEGEVDLYLDSIFPTVAVRRDAGTRIVLRRAVKGVLDYCGVLIAREDDGPQLLEELGGEIIAFQEVYSTSGYLLPAGILAQRGLDLFAISSLSDPIPADRTGYTFSRDEENTLAMVLDGSVAVGAMSSQDFDELPEKTKSRLRVVERTPTVPRQLVSIGGGVEAELEAAIRSILLQLTGERLGDEPGGWSWQFGELSAETEQAIATVEELIELIPEGV